MDLGMNTGIGNSFNGMLGNNNNIGSGNGWNTRNYAVPHYEIIRVNGEAGAKSFQMAPNSTQFLLDASTQNLIWVVQTDGAGYLTATPWDVFPHQVQQPVDVNSLEQRVRNLEDMYAAINTGSTKQSKKQRNANANTNANESATDSAN